MPDPQTGEIAPIKRIAIALERIATALEQRQDDGKDLNYFAPIEEFKTFDWGKIGAVVVKSDQYGAAVVGIHPDESWQQWKEYIRRSPDNAYDTAIFFSRCVGKDEDGKNKYERLITFKSKKPIDVNPISRKAEGLI
jgi:hypothetical protein